MPILFVLIVLGVLLIGIFLFIYSGHQRKIATFAVYAAKNGLRYSAGVQNQRLLSDILLLTSSSDALPGGLVLFANRDPFVKGQSNTLNHVFLGSVDHLDFVCAELKSIDDSGDTQETRYYSVSAIVTPMTFPYLAVNPEDAWSWIRNTLGVKGIQFESVEFNDRFSVASDNEKVAYDIIDPRMMEFLLAHPRCNIQTEGCGVLFCEKHHLEIDFVSYTRWFLAEFWTPNSRSCQTRSESF